MANEPADATPALAPRRSSRRESTSRASSPAPPATTSTSAAAARADSGDVATAAAAQETLDLSSSSSMRRSRRQVKSTYATHTLASPPPVLASATPIASVASPRPSPRKAATQPKDKKSVATTEAVVLVTVPIEEHERISKRRRPTPIPLPSTSAITSTSTSAVTVAAVSTAKITAVPVPKAPALHPDQAVKPEPSVQSPVPTQQVDTAAAVATVTDDTNADAEAPKPAAPASPPRSSTVPAVPAAAPNSANRRRRPASRQTAIGSGNAGNLAGSLSSSLNAVTLMGDADVSARAQERKVLDKYTGRECTLLCEAILLQIKRNSQDPKVLERDHSPAHIRWDKIAQKMLKAHRLTISPRDAQELWKFLAYAELPPARASQSNAIRAKEGEQSATTTAAASLDDQLLPASDTEDYCQSVQTINEKYKKRVTDRPASGDPQSSTTTAVPAADVVETPVKEEAPQGGRSGETVAAESQLQLGKASSTEAHAQPTEQATDPVQSLPASPATKAAPSATLPASRFRLYPAYDQPRGIPESWLEDKPFNVKETLPFTFVADKFLKKKPAPAAPAAATAVDSGSKDATAATAAAVVHGQAPAPVAADSAAPAQDKPKKKRVRKTDNAKPKAAAVVAADGSTLAEPPKPKKPRVTAQKSPAGSKATATPPKSPYVPSSTPPPQPLPPRAAFQFFCRMHEEEIAASAAAAAQLAISESTATGTTTTATAAPATTSTTSIPPVKKKTYFELQELFTGASLDVRNACQKLALEDLDRYNRECVRRRIWEKAMSNSSVASPQPAATTTATVSTPTTTTVPAMQQQSSSPPASIPFTEAPAPFVPNAAPKNVVTDALAAPSAQQ